MHQDSELLRDYNDRLALVYDVASSQNGWTPPREVFSVTKDYVSSGTRLLDVGIGTGQSAEPFFLIGCSVSGVDISPTMVALTKEKFPVWDVHIGSAEMIRDVFKQNSFDVIIASGCFEFIEDFTGITKSISALLVTGGYFCFTFEEFIPDSKTQGWKISELGKGFGTEIPKQISFLVYRRTVEDITSQLTVSGFSLIHEHQFIAYTKTVEHIPVIYRVVLAKKIKSL